MRTGLYAVARIRGLICLFDYKLPLALASGQIKQQANSFSRTSLVKLTYRFSLICAKAISKFIFLQIWLKPPFSTNLSPLALASGNLFKRFYMESVVKELEDKLLVPFDTLAKLLSSEYPNVNAKVYSYPVGSLTTYQGHSIGIECIFTDALNDESDNVALSVSLQHLDISPMIEADICWGHPSGYVEAEFLDDWVDVSDDVLERLYADLPRLCQKLVEAVERRRPAVT